MAPSKYVWPVAGERSLIGTRVSRVDGPAKTSGQAKYTLDLVPPGMLYGKMLKSPYALAKITALDVSAAKSMPGVKAVHVIQDVGTTIQWAGDEIVAVAATTEGEAEDALRAIKIEYQPLPHLVTEEDLSQVGTRGKLGEEQRMGDPDKAFSDPEAVISEGFYGVPVITHCCLEPHGDIAAWNGDQLEVHASTQAVTGLVGQFAEGLQIPASTVRVICQYIGGGFGSKFQADRWGMVSARLSKAAGAPVKLMLERDAEQMVAGCRPSTFANVSVAATKDGTLTGWKSQSWGTGGVGGAGVPPLPYVVRIPNQAKRHTAVSTNIGPARAWRAPNHPQACAITMTALDDLAAKLKMDPIAFYRKNAALLGDRSANYMEEFTKGAELAEWDKHWHPRGAGSSGPIKRGLGVSLHTWGGAGHACICRMRIQPDGAVEFEMSTQDLGTGTRTIMLMVAGETLGLPIEAITLNIGDSKYPAGGASGGSTTVGGVSSATRRTAIDALDQLFAAVAPSLGATADQLEAVGGQIRVKGAPGKALPWKQACAKLGVHAIEASNKNPGPGALISSGVGGVQIADVSVDTETGQVTMNRMVAVQDCGLVIDIKTAESQVFGALIIGVGYALFEEKIMDRATGRMLNPNMEFYKLAGLGDVGELRVHMMTGPGYDERGVIGLGEPPVISPGAAISNAVANAIGVRVSTLPLTPDKVLAALEKGASA